MRKIRHVVTAAVAMGLFAATVLFVGPAAMAVGPDTHQMIRDGKVVDMTATTVQIKEWGGTYTYRLSSTGRQALEVAKIRPGDNVRFTVSNPWGIAYDFALLRHDSAAPMSWRGSKKMDQHHVVVSPSTHFQVVGG